MKIQIINGPNLNMLGKREPEIYGHESFEDILAQIQEAFPKAEILYMQSNHEGEIIDRIQACLAEDIHGLVVNLGAFTHYSYAIYDALNMLNVPKVEVHISHIYAREQFRHTSVTAPACDGLITGLGKQGYALAVRWLVDKLSA